MHALRGFRPGGLVAALSLSTIAWLVSACGGSEESLPEGPVTWSSHVAEVVYENCWRCHREGEVAPFPLESYAQVRKRAKQIVRVTQDRYMPPWLPATGDHGFVGDRRLGDREIEIFARWLEQGAPEGDPSVAPAVPEAPGEWPLGPPDLVVEMPHDFAVPAEGPDLFWNFVIPVPIDRPRHVRGVDLVPGDVSVVHHAEIRVDPSGRSRELATDGGFSGTVEASNAIAPLGHFLGWAPGKTPFVAEAGGTWTLMPGSDLVLEMHLVPSGRAERVRARIGLYFSEVAPSELPVLLRLGRRDLDLPAGESRVVVRDAYVLPVEVEVRAVQPHAHFLGRTLTASYRLPDGTERTLIDIPAWDFGWQDAYRLDPPFVLPAGTTIEMRYVYDNSSDNPRNPSDPPRRVLYGPESRDEMGDLWIQVVAGSEADRRKLRLDRIHRDLEADRGRYAMMLEIDPDDARSHYGMGNVRYRQRDLAAAVFHYGEAIDRDPSLAEAHNDLGTVRASQGRWDAAERHYRAALSLAPASIRTRRNWARLLIGRGRFDEARPVLEALVAERPTDAEAHSHLGGVLFAAGELGPAEEAYETALRLQPGLSDARVNLERIRAGRGS